MTIEEKTAAAALLRDACFSGHLLYFPARKVPQTKVMLIYLSRGATCLGHIQLVFVGDIIISRTRR